MLVLTRRKEESIIIGDDIEITVLGIRGEQVRLGISAPAQISVHRKEVYDSLAQANRDAQATAGPLKSFLRMISGRKTPPRRTVARRAGHAAERRRRSPDS